VSVAGVPAGQVFQGVDPDTLAGWSGYRTEVGEFLFRRFDPSSQLQALAEFDAALQLDPGNARAATLRQRLIQQQTPGGVSRDLDMAPDVKDVSAGLLGETQLVLSSSSRCRPPRHRRDRGRRKDQLLGLRQLADRMAERDSTWSVPATASGWPMPRRTCSPPRSRTCRPRSSTSGTRS
jgi:hypothetical protein